MVLIFLLLLWVSTQDKDGDSILSLSYVNGVDAEGDPYVLWKRSETRWRCLWCSRCSRKSFDEYVVQVSLSIIISTQKEPEALYCIYSKHTSTVHSIPSTASPLWDSVCDGVLEAMPCNFVVLSRSSLGYCCFGHNDSPWPKTNGWAWTRVCYDSRQLVFL